MHSHNVSNVLDALRPIVCRQECVYPTPETVTFKVRIMQVVCQRILDRRRSDTESTLAHAGQFVAWHHQSTEADRSNVSRRISRQLMYTQFRKISRGSSGMQAAINHYSQRTDANTVCYLFCVL